MFVFNPRTNFHQRLSWFVGKAGDVLPEDLHDVGLRYGITGLVVKIADGLDPANETELASASWKDRYRGPEGLPIGGWAFGYGEDVADPAEQAEYHVARGMRLPVTGSGNRYFELNAEISWRNGDPDQEYLSKFRELAPSRMLSLCPEGSEWGPAEGYDYEAWLAAAARCCVQAYAGTMSPYDLYKVWKASSQAFPWSYTRLMLGVTSAPVGPGYWTAAIDKWAADRVREGRVKPLGGQIYLGENWSDDEWAIAEISEAMFRHGFAKT